MNFKKIGLVTIIFLFYITCANSEGLLKPPDGWQFPKDKGFFREWRNKSKTKYLSAKGDFNGDGITDHAFILQPVNKEGIAIFVLLDSAGKGNQKLMKIYDILENYYYLKGKKKYPEVDFIGMEIVNYGIEIVQPGIYLTACGQGFGECVGEGNESEKIEIKHIAISFFHYDAGGTRYYFWDDKTQTFKYRFMDD
jgi:hypothetical protein